MTCTFDPHSLEGIGMKTCPECGQPVVAGLPHPPAWTSEQEVEYQRFVVRQEYDPREDDDNIPY